MSDFRHHHNCQVERTTSTFTFFRPLSLSSDNFHFHQTTFTFIIVRLNGRRPLSLLSDQCKRPLSLSSDHFHFHHTTFTRQIQTNTFTFIIVRLNGRRPIQNTRSAAFPQELEGWCAFLSLFALPSCFFAHIFMYFWVRYCHFILLLLLLFCYLILISKSTDVGKT